AHQPGGGLDQQLQFSADLGSGEDLEPGQPEQGSRHRRRIVTHPESFTFVFCLAAITNRGGLGAYLSSPAQRRRVASESRCPRFNAKSRQCSHCYTASRTRRCESFL